MSPDDGTGHLYKERHGACHRCGWKGPVSKVGRHDRKRLHVDRSYGRLCADCASELLRHQSARPAHQAAQKTKLKLHRDRDVA